MPTVMERTEWGSWRPIMPVGISPSGVTIELRGAIYPGSPSTPAAEARQMTVTAEQVTQAGRELHLFVGRDDQDTLGTSNFGFEPPIWLMRAGGRGLAEGMGGTLIERTGGSSGRARIEFNRLPLAPTLTSPSDESTVNRLLPTVLAWTHQDPDGDPQVQAQVRWRPAGAGTWTDTTTITGTTQHHDVAAEIFPAGDIEWQVRTRDAEDWGPWSPLRTFSVVEQAPTVEIITPTDSATVTDPTLTIEWVTPVQHAAELTVQDPDQDVDILVEDIAPDVRSWQIPPEDLIPGRTIFIAVRVLAGTWSELEVIEVLYDPELPLEPDVTVSADNPLGMVSIHVTQPTPDGTPVARYMHIERSEVPGPPREVPVAVAPGDPPATVEVEDALPPVVPVAAWWPPTVVWTDPTVGSGRRYKYRTVVVAWSGAIRVGTWHDGP